MIRRLLVLAALAGVLVGGVLALLGDAAAADVVWAATTGLMLVPLTWSVARALWRHDVGVDAIALIAMASALATGEYLAGAVVAVMLAGGNALEEYAAGRARRELTKLLERAPRVAHRRREGAVEEVPVDDASPGRRGGRPGRRGDSGRRRCRRRGACRRGCADGRAAAGLVRRRAPSCEAGRRTPARRSTYARRDSPRRAPTRRSCASSAGPRRNGRRSSAWPTTTPPSSSRSRSGSPGSPGRRPGIRFASWP